MKCCNTKIKSVFGSSRDSCVSHVCGRIFPIVRDIGGLLIHLYLLDLTHVQRTRPLGMAGCPLASHVKNTHGPVHKSHHHLTRVALNPNSEQTCEIPCCLDSNRLIKNEWTNNIIGNCFDNRLQSYFASESTACVSLRSPAPTPPAQ